MKSGVYTIHDRLGETFGQLMVIPEKIVMRQLQYVISDMSRLDVQDKECIQIAHWDNETGVLEPIIPQIIADLADLKAKMEDKNG